MSSENSAMKARAAVDEEIKNAATDLVNLLGLKPESKEATPREVSYWIEIIDQSEIDTSSGEILWTTGTNRFASVNPEKDDIVYLFFRPELLCVGSYKIVNVSSPNGSNIVFKLDEESTFVNPLNLNTLGLHSEISNEIKTLYQSVFKSIDVPSK